MAIIRLNKVLAELHFFMEALGENLFPCLPQVLEVTQILSIFKVRNGQSSNFSLYHSDTNTLFCLSLPHLRALMTTLREGNGTPLQFSCLENPMDGGVWWAAVHGVSKSRTRLSDNTFTFHFHALEKEMATHSSVLAWRIPGTGEPGRLPSLGSQSRT